MNFPLILRLISYILLALSGAFLASMAVAFFYEPMPEGVFAFGLATAVSLLLTVLAWRIARNAPTERLLHKEAMAVIGLGWLLASLIGTLPYALLLVGYSLADAFFESVSGLTTTGASVLSDLENLPPSLLFWRALSQWMGGLGIVVFFVGILASLGAGAKILFSRESTGSSQDVFDGRIQTAALRITGLYLLISGICVSAFRLVGLSWFDAVCHMFTTVSTGGFSTRSASYAAFENPALEWTAMLFMVIGGISFLFLLRLLRGQTDSIKRNSEVPFYLMLLALASAIVILKEGIHSDWTGLHNLIRDGCFQVVSLMTTSGFATADYDQWSNPSRVLLLCCMLIGGCAGSTSGGFKVIRFRAMLTILRNHLEQVFRPQVVREPRINGKAVPAREREELFLYLGLTVLVLGLALLLISFFEPQLTLMSTISAAIACLFNIGPGFEAIGPTQTYVEFSSPTKLILSMLMILGRLEFYAILVLFIPSIWRKFS